jgi:hypothetical protein
MSRFWLPLGLGFVIVSASFWVRPATAQDQILTQMYGSGVHEFFAGDFQQAISDLSVAVDAGSKDPRVYYFRGLAGMRMGMQDQSLADFDKGANLEAGSPDRFYPVSRALERVQGQDRLMLEKHRAKARAVAYATRLRNEERRYEQLRRAEAGVLREPRVVPMETTAPPAPALTVPGARPALPPAAAPPAATPPPAAAPAEGDDPFGDTPAATPPAAAPPAAAGESDPFSDGPAAGPATTPPPAAETPAAESDPFADDPPAGTGAAEPPKEAPATPSAAGASEDDPFSEK